MRMIDTVAGNVCWCTLFLSVAKKRKMMRNWGPKAHFKDMSPCERRASLKPALSERPLCPQVSEPKD